MSFTLSVCLIVKNEERVLERSLSCAKKIGDELIVVDTGSKDNSLEIAKKFTPLVYQHPWQNSFAEARNYSYSKASGDYIMWLDADDIITNKNIRKIKALKVQGTTADVIFTIYKQYSQTGLTEYILRDRIIKRSVFKKWLFDIHEAIPIDPKWNMSYRADIEIIHKKEYVNEPDRNINIFNGLLKAEKEMSLFEKVNLVKEYSLHKKLDEAISLFDEIKTKIDPKLYSYAFSFLMAELVNEERWLDCYNAIEEAEKHIKDSPRMLYVKAICQEEMGDDTKAQKLFWDAISSKEDPLMLSVCYTGYNDYFPYLGLSYIALKNKDYKIALEYIIKASKAYPKDSNWLFQSLIFMMWEKLSDSKKTMILKNVTLRGNDVSKQSKVPKIKKKVAKINELLSTVSNEELEELLKDKELSYDKLVQVVGGDLLLSSNASLVVSLRGLKDSKDSSLT